MFQKNNYATYTLDELIAKQKSLVSRQKIFVGVAVICVCVTLYEVYKKSHNLHPFYILGCLFLIFNNGDKLKKIQHEINNKIQ